MDRNNNNIFTPARAFDGKKEFLEKMSLDKARNVDHKAKFKYAQMVQKYMRGRGARKSQSRDVTTELSKNL